MIHPWNVPLFRQLSADPEHLPHAILLHGPTGLGKLDLALELANWLLCQRPGGEGACGLCDACNWFAQGNHPDFRQVKPADPEEEEKEEEEAPAKKGAKKGKPIIKVNAIRELGEFLNLSSHRGGWRVAVIQPAERMNPAAANALLKTLEEPPPRVLLLLVSHQIGRLLPTVLSRCRKVAVTLPEPAPALAWLQRNGVADGESLLAEAGGAPLAALAFAEPERAARRDAFLDQLARPRHLDACQTAAALALHLEDAWGWLNRWVHDLVAQRLAGQPRYFPARARQTHALVQPMDLARLLDYQRRLAADGRWLKHPLNPTLLLESWLIRYTDLAGRHP